MKVRKKPVVVEAWQLHRIIGGDIEFDLPPRWVTDALSRGIIRRPDPGEWEIHTLEGVVCAYDGDYLVKGVVGELYPVHKEIFEETYEVLAE